MNMEVSLFAKAQVSRARQLPLDLPGVVPTAAERWSMLPEPARQSVLVLLARLIARGVLDEEVDTLIDVLSKLRPTHLSRDAFIYVRQSSLTQVRENTESLERQYELADRAMTLGWAPRQVVIIDNDLGQSGADTTTREGFKNLVVDVGLGKAGIILGIEVSAGLAATPIGISRWTCAR